MEGMRYQLLISHIPKVFYIQFQRLLVVNHFMQITI